MAAGGLVTVFRHTVAFAGAGLFCAALSWAGANPVAPLPLALLVAGLMIGSLNAWRWISRERQAMESNWEGGDD